MTAGLVVGPFLSAQLFSGQRWGCNPVDQPSVAERAVILCETDTLEVEARWLPGPSRELPMRIRFHFLVIETLDVCGNLFKTVLHGKMTGVETVHLRLR